MECKKEGDIHIYLEENRLRCGFVSSINPFTLPFNLDDLFTIIFFI